MADTSSVSQPAPPSVPAVVTATGQPTPQLPPIVINLSHGRLSRFWTWIGWMGFLCCGLFLLVRSAAMNEYFDTTGEVNEKYHSGAKDGRDKVAIISVSGTILDGSFVKQQIQRVQEDEHVKAVVLRIVSPGGTITGSDYIYHHLGRLRQEKELPLVVSMGSIAASGGYYVAMAVGDQPKAIYAEPTTWTGSIGVLIPHYDLSGLLARFDIKDDTLATHPRKQLMSMTKPLSKDHREVLQSYLDEAFTRFKDVIKEGRPVFRANPKRLDALATGEIYTAAQAKKSGLIDEIGFIEEAIDRALELAQLDKDTTRVVEYRRLPSLLDFSFLGESKSTAAELAKWLDANSLQACYLATPEAALLNARREPTDD